MFEARLADLGNYLRTYLRHVWTRPGDCDGTTVRTCIEDSYM